MSSDDAVGLMMAAGPGRNERTADRRSARLSVGDAVEVLVQLEHFLRPLAYPPPRTDLCHTTANGLGTLPALAAKWDLGHAIFDDRAWRVPTGALPVLPPRDPQPTGPEP